MREVYIEEILVEFLGDYYETTMELNRLLGGWLRTYPPKEDQWWQSQEMVNDYLSLIDRLNDKAPDGYYFGGHETQPQCLGFWRIP